MYKFRMMAYRLRQPMQSGAIVRMQIFMQFGVITDTGNQHLLAFHREKAAGLRQLGMRHSALGTYCMAVTPLPFYAAVTGIN
jgi:hypothetical protein